MNVIDKLYEIASPKRALARLRDRAAIEILRDYEAARPKRTSGGYKRRNTRASDEVAKGHRGLAGGAQDLVRNTALGNRIKAVIARNMIGTGIKPDYVGGSKRSTEKYKTAFDSWAESTGCDYEGHTSFYGLQHLWAATTVESGGAFIRRIIDKSRAFPLVLQTLEQQYLDDSKAGATDDGREIVSGIEFNRDGTIHGYWLKSRLTGYQHRESSEFFPAADIIHIFRKDRSGQHLGVSWFHPVADLISMRQEWRDAALTQQRIAACFGIVIKEAPKEMGLGTGETTLRDEAGLPFTELEPGMVAYTNSNTDITSVTPPNLTQSTGFNSDVVQDIAVGVGITREQLTGDFSKVTWASGRLARGEFYTNLDHWQQFMMIPALNRIHDWFDEIYTIMNGQAKVRRQWVIPHRSAVNPKEELEVDIMKVRSAAMTPQQFSSKHGLKFEDAIDGWREAKDLMGDLPFDFDPSKFSSAGNQLNASAATEDEPASSDKPELSE